MSKDNKNFLLQCSIINKDCYQKFLEYSNFSHIQKEIKINKEEKSEEIIQNNKTTIKFEQIKNLFENNQIEFQDEALDDIENLAFVSEDFLNKINGLDNKKNQVETRLILNKSKIIKNKW